MGVEDLPFLLERMLGSPHRIAALFRDRPLESLALRVDGVPSAMDHLAQLIHLDVRFQERIDDFMLRRPCLCSIRFAEQNELSAAQRDRSPGDVLEEFRLRRSLLVQRLRALDALALRHRALHPCSKASCTVVDMALWIAEHDDHNLAAARVRSGAPDR